MTFGCFDFSSKVRLKFQVNVWLDPVKEIVVSFGSVIISKPLISFQPKTPINQVFHALGRTLRQTKQQKQQKQQKQKLREKAGIKREIWTRKSSKSGKSSVNLKALTQNDDTWMLCGSTFKYAPSWLIIAREQNIGPISALLRRVKTKISLAC